MILYMYMEPYLVYMKKLLVVCSLTVCGLTYAQDAYQAASYTHQLELRHDNDFFALTDRYYSSGLFLTYRKVLAKGVFGEAEQLAIRLGQEVFTPSQTQSTNPALFDRPYAGFTGLWANWSQAKNNELLQITTLLGLAGVNSGAGGFQRWYHRAIAISDSPIWTNELENSIHVNLYASYTKEWEIAPNPFGIRMAVRPQLALGSRDVYGETEAILFFGRRNPIGESIAFDRLGSNSREIYFAFRFAYREVFYNGLIEGNLFGDNSPTVKQSKGSLVRLGFDFNHRFNRNDYKLGIRYGSPETANARPHTYVQLSYALSW